MNAKSYMKKRTKTIIYIGISPLILICLLGFLLILSSTGFFRIFTYRSDLNRLLHRTDHQALLVACRLLIKEGYEGKYKIAWPDKHPDVEKLPKEILALKPTYIRVEKDSHVHIELWGGMSHLGVTAYAEDFKKPTKNFNFGNKELIDGLWFRSDFVDLIEKNKEKK